MTVFLAQIDGRHRETGEPVTLRAASVDDERVCQLGGQVWWPALTQLPAFRYDLFDGAFGNAITVPQSSLGLGVEPWPDFPEWMLADARVQIWTGEAGAPWSSYVCRFDGRASSQPPVTAGVATVNFAVDDRWLDTPLLDTYAGTTGLEGDAALKGQPKPLALGAPRYVSGTLIDATNTVVQLSAYGAIEDVEVAFDRLTRFAASIGDFPNYAALVAATIPAGSRATCKAQGLVRHGAPPEGRLSYLVRGDKAGPGGWVRKPGALIKRIALLRGAADRIDMASLDSLDAARPWDLSVYIGDQTTPRELIQQIAASVNAVAGMSWLGKLFVTPVEIGAPSLTLDATGAALPPVASVERMEIAAPFWRLAIEAEKTWSVHGLGEIAFTAALIERGPYDSAETYREGHIASNPDGSRWLYVAASPSSGNAPAEGSAFWSLLSAAPGKALVRITASPSSFSFDGFGSPRAQTTIFEAVQQGGTGPIVFIVRDRNGLSLASGSAAGIGASEYFDYLDDQSISMTHAQFAAFIAGHPERETFSVEAAAGEASDIATVTKVQDGQDGENGLNGIDGIPGPPGANGVTLYTWVAYANSADGTVDFAIGAPGTRAYIGIANNRTSSVEGTNPADYTWSLIRGTDGVPGTPGADGSPTYTWFAYANSPDGTVDFTTGAPAGRYYLGIAPNQLTPTESTNPAHYTWTLIRGANGTDGLPGTPGADGVTYYPYYAYANSPDGTVDFTTGAPGSRAYVGFATGTSPSEPTSPGSYAWSAYKGPPFGMATRGNAVVAGDQIIKQGGAEEWDSDAYSTVGYRGGAAASFRPGVGGGQYFMVGLNSDPTADASYASLDYAWYLHLDGTVVIFENGSGVITPFVGYDSTFVFQIVYDGATVRYLCNGTVYREVAVAADLLFYFDCSLAGVGTRIEGVDFRSFGRRGLNGEMGPPGPAGVDGIPGSPGIDGLTPYVHFAYANSADGTVDFTTGAGGSRTYIGVYSDYLVADSTNPAIYTWSLIKGADGANGTPGPPGTNGLPTYVHIAYSSSADGTVNFHVSDPTGRTYIGVYTDFTLADSTNPASYSWSLIKGADGAPGTPGTPGAPGRSVDVSTNSIDVAATYSGVTKGGQLPKNVSVKVMRGTVDVTASCSIALTRSDATNIAASYASGVITLTLADVEGYIDVGGTDELGSALPTKRIQIMRPRDPAPPASPTSVSKAELFDLGVTSYPGLPPISVLLQSNASGQIRGEVFATYGVATVSTFRASVKLAYRVPGGSWVDMTTETQGSQAQTFGGGGDTPPDPIDGTVTQAQTVSGLSANTIYEVAAFFRKSAGTAATAFVTAGLTARHP